MITPTEYGTGADVKGVAEEGHRCGIPLRVDEAWGAHSRSTPICRPRPRRLVPTGRPGCTRPPGACASASIMLLGGDLVDPVDLGCGST